MGIVEYMYNFEREVPVRSRFNYYLHDEETNFDHLPSLYVMNDMGFPEINTASHPIIVGYGLFFMYSTQTHEKYVQHLLNYAKNRAAELNLEIVTIRPHEFVRENKEYAVFVKRIFPIEFYESLAF